jgi:hypothetical protein
MRLIFKDSSNLYGPLRKWALREPNLTIESPLVQTRVGVKGYLLVVYGNKER